MNIIYGNSDETNVCHLLSKIDKCLKSGDFGALTIESTYEWIPNSAKKRLEWINSNYNLSINYPNNYNYGMKESVKRMLKRIVHKLIKFNLLSICLHQTEFNAQMARIQNHQYHLIGQLMLEIGTLQKENEELRDKVNNLVNTKGDRSWESESR